jgi:hypothetical protein
MSRRRKTKKQLAMDLGEVPVQAKQFYGKPLASKAPRTEHPEAAKPPAVKIGGDHE